MKRWQLDEEEACAMLDATRVGGPGQPDCVGDGYIVEVKSHRGRRVHAGMLRRTLDKPWANGQPLKFVAITEFTEGAIELAEDRGVELYVKKGRALHPVCPCLADEQPVETTGNSAGKWVAGILLTTLAVGGAIALYEHSRR